MWHYAVNTFLLSLFSTLLCCSPARSIEKDPNEILFCPNTKLELQYEENHIILNNSLFSVKDSVLIFSLSFIKGIEAYRIELFKRNVFVYNRIFHTYATMRLAKINILLRPKIRLKKMQQWVTRATNGDTYPLEYSLLGHTASLYLHPANVVRSQKPLSKIDITKYKKIKMLEMFKF